MAYRHFTLEKVVHEFALQIDKSALFKNVKKIPISSSYAPVIKMGLQLALPSGSEKIRNELLVMPMLLELYDRNQERISIHSGVALNVDRKKGLVGECDFLLSLSKITAFVDTPIFAVVEAKKQNIEIGLGQCAAQMVGIQLLNQRREKTVTCIFGCVTTGAEWRFLKLQNTQLLLDNQEYSIRHTEEILGVFQAIVNFY
jgi:hypothetical protein